MCVRSALPDKLGSLLLPSLAAGQGASATNRLFEAYGKPASPAIAAVIVLNAILLVLIRAKEHARSMIENENLRPQQTEKALTSCISGGWYPNSGANY